MAWVSGCVGPPKREGGCERMPLWCNPTRPRPNPRCGKGKKKARETPAGPTIAFALRETPHGSSICVPPQKGGNRGVANTNRCHFVPLFVGGIDSHHRGDGVQPPSQITYLPRYFNLSENRDPRKGVFCWGRIFCFSFGNRSFSS